MGEAATPPTRSQGKLLCMAVLAAGLAVGGWVLAKRLGIVRSKRNLLEQYQRTFKVPKKEMLAIQQHFKKEMELALKDDTKTTLRMLPSYILDLPTGEETGEFYAIDVGGTNIRVMYCELGKEKGKVDAQAREDMEIPELKKKGTAEELFDFIAGCLKSFVTKIGRFPKAGKRLPVGFCFSFPLNKSSPKSGLLLQWTKGYECSGAIGKDSAAMLQEAFSRMGLPADVYVILNDTIGVLAAGRYEDDRTDVGVILGTGTNAACVEPVINISKWHPTGVPQTAVTAVNTEWGCFDSVLLPRCEEDLLVDKESTFPGEMRFEKLISGANIGEIVRHLMRTMAWEGLLFEGTIPPKLDTLGGFPTPCVAKIDADTSDYLHETAHVLQSRLSVNPTISDRKLVKEICDMVSDRAAMLLAGAIVAVVQHVRNNSNCPQSKPTVVTFDGGCYENFSGLRTKIRVATEDMLGWIYGSDVPQVILSQCQGGSCLGAAILAAATSAVKEDTY